MFDTDNRNPYHLNTHLHFNDNILKCHETLLNLYLNFTKFKLNFRFKFKLHVVPLYWHLCH